MLMHTLPRLAGTEEERAVNALRLEPKPDVFHVRVTGDDPAEVCRAAGLVSAAVQVTKRGHYWFTCELSDLATIREDMVLGSADLAAWLWWARPRSEYFLPGMQLVDFTYDDPDGLGSGSGLQEERREADTPHILPGLWPPLDELPADDVPDGSGGAAGGDVRDRARVRGGELHPDELGPDAEQL